MFFPKGGELMHLEVSETLITDQERSYCLPSSNKPKAERAVIPGARTSWSGRNQITRRYLKSWSSTLIVEFKMDMTG
jgi:hypothetical protein